ncbi:hypothetical protein MTQ10_10140 [Streptomyces sp. XM83C]|jgi:hypothetical protein|uniref:DUF11 domain-containing protein n=1 Tax=Streptomyces thermocoprophilus TaxID=78356 RepID=A0ABV5VFD6_9ACTN|nr:hypothetical protein [Streptomyces sp. XM83C]MCK1819968.1 hypothetical protein [Streptomyces sp. XM83C]
MWGTALAALGAVGAAPPAGAGVPEADLAYHGSAAMAGGLMDVALTPRNHGPSAVPEAAVRLRWSAPLAERQPEPAPGCVRTGLREVVCRTGALPADGVGERIELVVRLAGRPAEARLEIETVWGGGRVDRDVDNDRQRVLVLDTGDRYYF